MDDLKSSRESAKADVARHFIIGTAGHIDHGKTSLVHALTGTNPDRLPEEQRRGMTIELGFAGFAVDDIQFGVVDVPGHEKFVRTMVAGATGIDIALLVVAADDSVMPQTIEHVEILHLLGVKRCVVALTKVDKVDEELAALAEEEVQTLLATTPFTNAAVCPVSSLTGQGLDRLRAALSAAASELTMDTPRKPFRMAIDRVFTVPGRGTVVTGSTLRGAVEEGETLELMPAGVSCKVRGLQTHGVALRGVGRGQRAAINLAGVDREAVERGHELATPGYLRPSHLMDVKIKCLTTAKHPLRTASTVRLGMGTRETPVRVVLLQGEYLEPGAEMYAQLRSGEPLIATHGQRFILRDASATRTIGGGVVLSPNARRRRRHADLGLDVLEGLDHGDQDARVAQVLRMAGFNRPPDLAICAQAGVELEQVPAILLQLQSTKNWITLEGTDVRVSPAALEDFTLRLVDWVERYHRGHPDEPGRNVDSVVGWLERTAGRGVARPMLDSIVKKGRLKSLGRFICAPAFAPALSTADEKLFRAIVEEIQSGAFQPPGTDELKCAAQVERKRVERLVTLGVALGELVRIEPKMYVHREVERRMREVVGELIGRAGSVSVAEIREALHSSRKFVVPFVEYLDRIGFTRRVEDRRVLVNVDQETGK
ncbi:MAG: selenocysteine-specific translation elongation factor [Planctomycetota bacterium]